MNSHPLAVPARDAKTLSCRQRPRSPSRLLGGCCKAFALLIGCGLALPSHALTYVEARTLVEQSSPALQAQQAALSGAMAAQGSADALPDPRLSVGIENLPISGADRFSLSRDFMTMQRIGLMQEVPNLAKRDARTQGAHARADRERAVLTMARLQLLQALDRAWLSAQFALRREAALAEVTLENQRLQASLPGRVAAGTAQATDLLMARQEALALADRRDDLARDELKARAALRRLVGPRADEPLIGDASVPAPEPAQLRAQLSQNADLAVYPAMLGMAQAELREAQAESRGDWSWEVAYSRRGAQWGDMVSLQLSFDLPWQKDRRQLPAIKAKQREAERIEAEREDLLRRRAQEQDEQVAELGALDRQLERLNGAGLRLARERVELAMAGYQSGKADLGAVLSVRRELLEARLRVLELEAQRADLRARLNNLVSE
ncbi:MAG: TolC family protein [Paucibacter sp.]|nr:TolC family protein [Roseateles sp.]